MKQNRRQHDVALKKRVVAWVSQGNGTFADAARKFNVVPSNVAGWCRDKRFQPTPQKVMAITGLPSEPVAAKVEPVRRALPSGAIAILIHDGEIEIRVAS